MRTLGPDPRAAAISESAAQLGVPLPPGLAVADVVFVEGDLSPDALARLGSFLVDPLLQSGSWATPTGGAAAVEITLRPGVTDTVADAVVHAGTALGVPVTAAASGRRIELPERADPSTIDLLLRRIVANPVIERWEEGTVTPAFHPGSDDRSAAPEVIAIRSLDAAGLAELGARRALALDPEELEAIRSHFDAAGRDPTDVELEMVAQTWSEHCAHKTFRATLLLPDGTERRSLLDELRHATDEIAAPFVRSAFVGNAGIVSFTDGVTVALKAETHNHPSAVEPFGGANTGIGGVIRDVLGAAHRPIAVTDVLCFGPSDASLDAVPAGSLHPARIREGVVAGVADYGNKIGLPTVAGAVLYDAGYTTNPLVFCGCIGVADEQPFHAGPNPGDRVVVLGGRTGRDGIRGATFSSATMDATTGEVAGASVQIGDPVTEKLLIDVLVGSEDLWTAITDCGAGGLSSAVGEMAEGIGADVELDLVPLKYPGLEPWEIWLSEAQERMVVAVPPDRIERFAERCARHGVELADLGAFTGDRRLVVRRHGEVVVDLDTSFLHDGRPTRRMRAEPPTPDRRLLGRSVTDVRAALLALLTHPNIASKADVIHRYDHEILGSTVVRPLVGVAHDAPADGVVVADPRDTHGLAIGVGVNPWYGELDPEAMAAAAVDEAIRNVVAVGADPDRVALLDNFSWGDPRRPSTLGALVAAVDGCVAAARSHRAPFVSGKDSLNNEYTTAGGERHAVPPTLVITAVAHVPDAGRCATPELAEPGDLLVLVGATSAELGGGHLDLVLGAPDAPGAVPQPDPEAPDRYRRLHAAMRADLVVACHDVSEGGLGVALAEMCIAGRLGAAVDVLPHPDAVTALFSESTGRLVLEVRRDALAELERIVGPVHLLGTVTGDACLALPGVGPIPLHELVAAFSGDGSASAS